VVVELDARIGAGPCGVADLFQQIAGFWMVLGRSFAVFAVPPSPIAVFTDICRTQIGERGMELLEFWPEDVLEWSFNLSVGIIGRKLDRNCSLARIIQHALA